MLFVSVLLVDILVADGKSNYLEGLLLGASQAFLFSLSSRAYVEPDDECLSQSRCTSSSPSPSGSPSKTSWRSLPVDLPSLSDPY